MSAPLPLRYRPASRADIKDALRWSLENFGEAALLRYKALIRVAIEEIAADPALLHSYELTGLQPGIRLYHLRHSKNRAAVEGKFVGRPRHFIAYKVEGGALVLVRILHDSMELESHISAS